MAISSQYLTGVVDHPPENASPITDTMTLSTTTLVNTDIERYERPLGDSELSFYFPSRENGVNDMCVLLH